MMINKERLAELFKFLVEIDSESGQEAAVCFEIKKIMESLGCKTVIDGAGVKTGSDTGNLIAKFDGSVKKEPILLNAHMDTVAPGKGVKALLKSGIFTSAGNTVLGSDDKSAIAIFVEVLRVIKEKNIKCPPIEFVFTIGEEIGLLGAKYLNYDLISAKYGYVLDTVNTFNLITKAPFSNHLEFTILGKDAHAGIEPEKGINAICIASRAISDLKTGRIDDETTCNIGTIKGGIASNIVPDKVEIKAEVRSHSEDKLKKETEKIIASFENAVEFFKKSSIYENIPNLKIKCEKDFNATNLDESHKVVLLAEKAAATMGKKLLISKSGGGSDANVFFEKGIITGVIGTGMKDVHTINESISLYDMADTAEFILEILMLA
jgi:tripeptide aminopeptidase